MRRGIVFGVVVLAAFGFLPPGCSYESSVSGGSGGAASGGASGGSSTTAGSGGSGGAASGGASGGSSTTAGSGGSGGSGGSSTTSSAACGTTDGTYEENTTFGTDGKTEPYNLNKWGTWGNGTEPTLTQTTTGPEGLDCSSGCAKLTIDFSDGTAQYSAGSFVEY
ncbi:MAG: hypothetical protein JXP73_11215, partial [Deltaproteobacteria bacterium]|nr:hypothetical protein [Deltaproteobacteria bacterium]